MSYLIVAAAALAVSTLTLYSGFGLGTMLLPVFALFFSVEAAVAATAVVHGANNVFKISVVGRHADRTLVLHFGIPAIFAAFAGAAALGFVSHLGQVAAYSIGSRTATITPVKLMIAVLIFGFAIFELLPRLKNMQFDRRYLFVGGLLSGFFGGLSGHQGALRSAFLIKTGVTTESFVGTNAVIGFMVDAARLAIYLITFLTASENGPIPTDQWPLIVTGIAAAFAGVILGKRYLEKIKIKTVQTITGTLLLAISVLLGAGLI